MIKFDNVINGHLGPLSFEIETGEVCFLTAGSDEERGLFLDVFYGLRRPEQGSVYLFGKEIYSISTGECIKLFGRAGVVQRPGGLISNLKIWENITLSAAYRTGKTPAELEDRLMELAGRLGMDKKYLAGLTGRLPASLPMHEKRMAGLLRAMLAGPELMFYDSLFDGLSPELAATVRSAALEFHKETPGRTSVFLSVGRPFADGVDNSRIIAITGEKGAVHGAT